MMPLQNAIKNMENTERIDMEYQIVPMDRSHIPQIAALERECFSAPWSEAMLDEELFNPQASFLVAEDREGNVLGYAGLHVVLDEGYIDNVAVRSDSRGQGVASALLGVYCRFGQAHLAFLTMEVRAGNRPAIQLYLKHGFEQVGRRKNYYRQPTEDAIIMTKEFAHGTEDPETGAAAADL